LLNFEHLIIWSFIFYIEALVVDPPTCTLAHESYTDCGTACPLTCENVNNPPMFCTANCVVGCFCDVGYVRAENGSCILPKDCPACKLIKFILFTNLLNLDKQWFFNWNSSNSSMFWKTWKLLRVCSILSKKMWPSNALCSSSSRLQSWVCLWYWLCSWYSRWKLYSFKWMSCLEED